MKKLVKKFKDNGGFNPIVGSIKKVIGWSSLVGISYLIQLLGWTEMAKAYFVINIALFVISFIITIFSKGPAKPKILGVGVGILYALLPVLASWIVSLIFKFDFFEVYMLVYLGECFITPIKKK